MTAAAAAADVPTIDLAPRRVVLRRRDGFGGRAGHLLGETDVQIVEEFLARGVATRPGRPQLDRRSDLRRLEVVGLQTPWGGDPGADRRRICAILARSWLAPIVDLRCQSERAMLQHLRISHADAEFRG